MTALRTRRSMIASSAAAAARALPAWMPRLAFRAADAPPRGDVLVCVFQRGGMDGLSAVIPYEERRYYDLRPALAIKAPRTGDAKSGRRLDDRFALNPAMPGLGRLWDDGRLAVVHAVGSPDDSRSHFDAMDYMERGTPGERSVNTGWIGRHLEATAARNGSPFRAVGMGDMLPLSLYGPVSAAALRSIADFHLDADLDLAAFQSRLRSLYGSGDWFDENALGAFEALAILERADPQQYRPENGAAYPETSFGRSLAQIAQLIKADVGLEVACVDIGEWDTHAIQVWQGSSDPTEGLMSRLLASFDAALAAFAADLGRRLDDPGVTVVTMSEFGRRVAQNGGNGTDHGHGNCMFVLGGGVVKGVHTIWPGLEPDALSGGEDLAVTIDYRDVLGEIVLKRLANAALPSVFPGFTPTLHGVVRARADAPDAPATPVPGGASRRQYFPWAGRTA
ncbi:MAG: DUF1501 domain-containing protein [Ardenticatenales bacterium]|nr:DUF1501 domain-containing protein [Ardenticatenales bacterium]